MSDEQKEARERVKGWFDDPKHQRVKGHPDDERTKDDRLDDPRHQKGDEE